MIMELRTRGTQKMGGLAAGMELANRCCRPDNQIVRQSR